MQFSYKAKDKTGKTIKGVLQSQNKTEASQVLREKQFYVVQIKEIGSKSNSVSIFKKKVSIKDKIIFTKQLGIMIKSGLSIIEALEALEEETQNPYFMSQIKKIIADVQGGTPLSEALKEHNDTFSEIYINMVGSGEESGKVDMVLERLSIQLEKDYDLNHKLKSALAYPIFVLFALTVVGVLVLTLIIPQLKVIFDSAGVELPLLTRIVLGLSGILRSYGIFVLVGFIILASAISRYKKTTSGRRYFDKQVIRIPVFGTLLKKTYMSRFTRNFASLSASGLPLLDIFKVTSNTIGNVIYKEEIEKMAGEIKSGVSISAAIKKSPIFPKMVGQLATVGEKSGSMDEVFETLADFFDKDVDAITGNLSTLLEPVIMLVLGAGIGLLIVSVIQPMYGLVNAV